MMSGVMQALFDYVIDQRVQEYLPIQHDHFCGAYLNALEETLMKTLSEEQKTLWKQWYDAQGDYEMLYEEALFQAAFALANELSA